ncbi:NAD(P)-dependent dehydrogenase (short-subunit alcohol dehydrogenase family) [Luteimonas sp. J16]|uniref:SDR family oxidoreductase n=1 Tax=Luteimonas sp. J16 TaxID=935283 RepID=UPI0011AADCF3|nr:SDR family oxidoreductase [Luteimonas sp. J16]TWG90541.1 NAD(P)-dependent dehydrogenase (short-subunit alcohol dehydrogenase family) [Luteimonas sp. J16]
MLGAGSAAGLAAGRAVLAVGMDDATRQALSGRHPQGRLRALLAPVASDADAAALARRLRTPGLVVDGVVASLAGSHPCGRLIDEPAEVLQRTLDQDLLPHLFAARHLLPLLAEGSAGYVLIGGPGGRYPWAGYGHCSIAAAALRMMARVLHEEAGREGQRVQLLSMDAPVAADSPAALALGRRALAMLDEARHQCPAPIHDYAGEMTSAVIAGTPAAAASFHGIRAHRTTAGDVLPARHMRSARALLDAIASPTSPGSVHDEY